VEERGQEIRGRTRRRDSVSGFSADWLSMREPFDAAARATPLVAELRRHIPRGTSAAPFEVVDLGAGAGSNLRYLAPRLGGEQRWRLVDHDRALLHAAVVATRAWAVSRSAVVSPAGATLTLRAADFACRVSGEPRDLAGDALASLALPSGGLVTAAALLDLVSTPWLEALATRCKTARAAVCFALTYDGRAVCTPDEPEDAMALDLFNRHQRLDKGFGPALGPTAAVAAEQVLAKLGFRVLTERSDWDIGPQHTAMQHALLDGWLRAALEIAPEHTTPLTAWHRRRRAHVDAGRSRLVVGHVDLVAWL
jgi:hypothetical protein